MGQGPAEARGAGPTAWAPRAYGAQRSQATRNPIAGQREQMMRDVPAPQGFPGSANDGVFPGQGMRTQMPFPGQGGGVEGGFPGRGGPFGGGMPVPPRHSEPIPPPAPQHSMPMPMPQMPPQAMGGGIPQQMPARAFGGGQFPGQGAAPDWLPPMLQQRFRG